MKSCSAALPYHEPTLQVILSISGLLLLLNVVNHLIDRLCFAGLVAQIVLGALWGTPLGGLLNAASGIETAFQQLGYLGLLLLVTEGGLDTQLHILSDGKTFLLAFLVGSTGVLLPIGFSLLLLPLGFGYGLLESFACGASLCATSLGTMLTLLSSVGGLEDDKTGSKADAGLLNTRVGTILIGAALLDDIIGLVLSRVVQVIGQPGALQPWTVARPVVASLLLVSCTALVSRFLFRPALQWAGWRYSRSASASPTKLISSPAGAAFIALLAILLGFVTIAHYIDASPLIGVFCAGAMVKYCFETFKRSGSGSEDSHISAYSPHAALQRVRSLRNDILLPMFFASIGFAIPLREMFHASLVWKGFIYAGLMALAKTLAGGWLLVADILARRRERESNAAEEEQQGQVHSRTGHWVPPLLLGLSLVARGEIGFLIIALAQQSGLVGGQGKEEAYMVAIWALVLNTLAGPILAGILLKSKGGVWARSVARGRWELA